MKKEIAIELIQPFILPITLGGIAYFWGKDIYAYFGSKIVGKSTTEYGKDIELVMDPQSYKDVARATLIYAKSNPIDFIFNPFWWAKIDSPDYISQEQYRANIEKIKKERGF